MSLSTILTIGSIVSGLLFVGALTYLSLKLFKPPIKPSPTKPPTTNPPTTNPPTTNPPTTKPSTKPPTQLTCANSYEYRAQNLGNTFQNKNTATVTGPDGKCYESTTLYPAPCKDIKNFNMPSNSCSFQNFVKLPKGMISCKYEGCTMMVSPLSYCRCPKDCIATGSSTGATCSSP